MFTSRAEEKRAQEKAKRKAKEKIHDVAAELLEIYALREAQQGFVYRFSQQDYMARAAELMGMDIPELTQYLWLNYNPPLFGVILMSLGILTSLALIIYDKIIFRYN